MEQRYFINRTLLFLYNYQYSKIPIPPLLQIMVFQVFIDKLERRVSQNSSDGGGDNDPDFFDQDIHKPATIDEAPMQKYETSNGKISKAVTDDGSAPNVEAALVMSPTQAQEKLGTRKPTIGQRKPAKKGGVSTLGSYDKEICKTVTHVSHQRNQL